MSVVLDSAVVAKRNLIKIKRVPDLLVFTTLSPIMFVLLFAYVFGGAIDPAGGGSRYREFLIAGIFAQTMLFGAIITGVGLANDVNKGIVDRFRSLPIAPSAVLAGRTFSDVVNNVIVLVVMSATGLLIGWRIHTGVASAVWGFLLLLIFAHAVSWITAWIGLLVSSPEVVHNATFVMIFPLTFLANTFVPLATLPGPLRGFAAWNPVSALTEAVRALFGNPDLSTGGMPASWALQHPQLYTLIWAAAILIVFVPLANVQFRRATGP